MKGKLYFNVVGEAVKVNVLEAPHNVAIPPVQQQTFRPSAGQFNKVCLFIVFDRTKCA
jgi:hypothetical protein